MNRACISEPVSWLKLEMYELGELDPLETAAVKRHLESCPACSSRLDYIVSDRRTLPGLPLPTARRLQPAIEPRFATKRLLAAASLLAAAALALVVLVPAKRHAPLTFSGKAAVKGGELAILLVRERSGTVQEDPKTFSPGDRFMIQVTCPPGSELFWDVAVFQGDNIYFPYQPQTPLSCGNRVPLQGAFTLDGINDAAVCLFVDATGIDRTEILASDLDDMRENGPRHTVACKLLKPGR